MFSANIICLHNKKQCATPEIKIIILEIIFASLLPLPWVPLYPSNEALRGVRIVISSTEYKSALYQPGGEMRYNSVPLKFNLKGT